MKNASAHVESFWVSGYTNLGQKFTFKQFVMSLAELVVWFNNNTSSITDYTELIVITRKKYSTTMTYFHRTCGIYKF